MDKPHPTQPLELDSHGVLRFKGNKIIRYLFDTGKLDLNELGRITFFGDEDRVQLAQLLGYSLCGFGDLSYVSDEVYDRAEEEGKKY